LGCYFCIINEERVCVIKDDFFRIREKISNADGIFYIANSSFGITDIRLKTFLDRDWLTLHRPYQKKIYAVSVALAGGGLNQNCNEYIKILLESHGINFAGSLDINGIDNEYFRRKRI
jgi:multimeric flavodoxin WrbA